MDLASIKSNMPADNKLKDLTNLFKVFGEETRAKIIYTIENNELCVNDICSLLNMSKSRVSHQLKILRDAHLVCAKRKGKEVYYSLADEHISLIFKCALEHINE